MVYCAGHGFNSPNGQYLVLQDDDHCLLPIEDKLRALASFANVNVLAIYDMHLIDKSVFDCERFGFNENLRITDEIYEYMHICTHPLQPYDAKPRLTERIMRQLETKSKEGNGVVQIPKVWEGLKGVEYTYKGATYRVRWDPAALVPL